MRTRSPRAAAVIAALAASACSKPQAVKPEAPPPPVVASVQAPAPREVPAEVVETLRANFRRVQFAFDDARLADESVAVLRENARLLKAHPSVRVTIEGHTDHFGTTEYNLALGQRRADAVHRFLVELGVPKDRLQRTAFGEERPLVGAGDRDAVAPDRRAEFRVTAGEDVVSSSDSG